MFEVSARLVINPADLERIINSPSGPVAAEFARLGARMEASAKRLLSGELINVDTGRLRASTTWALGDRGGLVLTLGSGAHYSVFLHEGTRYIEARPYLEIAARENGLPV